MTPFFPATSPATLPFFFLWVFSHSPLCPPLRNWRKYLVVPFPSHFFLLPLRVFFVVFRFHPCFSSPTVSPFHFVKSLPLLIVVEPLPGVPTPFCSSVPTVGFSDSTYFLALALFSSTTPPFCRSSPPCTHFRPSKAKGQGFSPSPLSDIHGGLLFFDLVLQGKCITLFYFRSSWGGLYEMVTLLLPGFGKHQKESPLLVEQLSNHWF